MEKLIYIGRLIGSVGRILVLIYGVGLPPVGTGLKPAHSRKSAASSKETPSLPGLASVAKLRKLLRVVIEPAVSLIAQLLELLDQGHKQVPHIPVDRKITVDGGLLQLLLIHVADDDIGLPGPGLVIIAHLADAESGACGKHQVAVLYGKVTGTVSHVSGASRIKGMAVGNGILVVPARYHRDPQHIRHLHKEIVGPGDTDAVSRVEYGPLRLLDPPDDLLDHRAVLGQGLRLFFQLLKELLIQPASASLQDGEALRALLLILLRGELRQALRLHIGSLDIQGNVQPAGAGASGLGQIDALFQGIEDPLGVGDHLAVLGHAVDAAGDIEFLVSHGPDPHSGPAGGGVVAHLSGKDDHGDGVQPGSHHPRDGIGASRTRGDAEAGGLIVDPGIGLCGNGTGLLVMHVKGGDARGMAQAVVQMHCPASRNGEAVGDAVFFKNTSNQLRDFYFHKFISCSPDICTSGL